MIRELRALIPVAEAYEARQAKLQKQFGTDASLHAMREAGEVTRLAQSAVLETVAVTPAGLPVKVRFVGLGAWYDMGGSWGALLRSAAAVTAVTLPEPEYDAAGWV